MSEKIKDDEVVDVEEITEENQSGKKKRPMFLTVLCVLSIIWGISQVYVGISAGFGGTPSESEIAEMREGMEEMKDEESMVEFADDSIAYIEKSVEVWQEFYLTSAALYILGLAGVVLMWRLDRRGYFMYGAAHLGITFLPALLVMTNTYVWATVGFSFFITVLFMVLYGLNLKHMK